MVKSVSVFFVGFIVILLLLFFKVNLFFDVVFFLFIFLLLEINFCFLLLFNVLLIRILLFFLDLWLVVGCFLNGLEVCFWILWFGLIIGEVILDVLFWLGVLMCGWLRVILDWRVGIGERFMIIWFLFKGILFIFCGFFIVVVMELKFEVICLIFNDGWKWDLELLFLIVGMVLFEVDLVKLEGVIL